MVGCGGGLPSGSFAGTSAHFRLWIDDSIAHSSTDASEGLAALETNWSDTQSVLAMPDGRIDYYWLAAGHVVSACHAEAGGCEGDQTIYTYERVSQHELNHAYAFLRGRRVHELLIEEGLAQAVGCAGGGGPNLPISAPWRDLVPGDYSSDLYDQGLIFVRYLISTYGIERFLAYYDQAPSRGTGADDFAANFQAFWSVALDDVWTAMHDQPPADVNSARPLCPCALPALPTDGVPLAGPWYEHPYWTVGDLGGDSLSISAPFTPAVADCSLRRTDLHFYSELIARFDGGRFLAGSSIGLDASRGKYISDTCGEAVERALPIDFTDRLGVAVARPTTDAITVYLRLRATEPHHVTTTETISVCASCDFTDVACAPATAGTAIPIDGSMAIRVTFPAGPTLTPNLALTFGP
jgi:hypothetical protein